MRNTIVCDIDDTITIVGERRSILKQSNPDYDLFHNRCNEDKPNIFVIELIKSLSCYDIIFVTMRPESVRQLTLDFINKYIMLADYGLLMRKDGDRRSLATVKTEMIIDNVSIDNILLAIDDSDDVIRGYKRLGIDCIKVIGEIKQRRINKYKSIE